MAKNHTFEKSLFIFRRDLRLEDNTGLIHALENSKTVIPIFIYDNFFINNFKDSNFRWNFLNESLLDLNAQLVKRGSTLQIFKGNPKSVLKKIFETQNIDSVFLNADISFYSKKRDSEILQICKESNVELSSHMDFFLQNPTVIKTNMDRPYTIYSQFYKKARTFPVRKIRKNSLSNFYNKKISNYSIFASNGQEDSFGGRTNALSILKTLDKFKNYDSTRDYPSNLTTRLSAHIKFGTLSIREIHNAIQENLSSSHTLMREIYWREFFNYVCFHFPSSTQKSFKKKYQKFPWIKSKVLFAAWCSGNTGFPIVDAGMRELNKTGFMHNRVRMIVGSFLTKDLHIDWKLGERYFAKKLVDYDPAVNSGNWQWVASTGCDSVPYFRIFNPWIQQEKFDKECIYIKKWIPELGPFSPEVVHNLWKTFPENLNYSSPIVNHKVEAQKTKELFKKLS